MEIKATKQQAGGSLWKEKALLDLKGHWLLVAVGSLASWGSIGATRRLGEWLELGQDQAS